jgi:hypothetical protein
VTQQLEIGKTEKRNSRNTLLFVTHCLVCKTGKGAWEGFRKGSRTPELSKTLPRQQLSRSHLPPKKGRLRANSNATYDYPIATEASSMSFTQIWPKNAGGAVLLAPIAAVIGFMSGLASHYLKDRRNV